MNIKFAFGFLLISLLLAIAAGFFASPLPDGLEWVAGKFGFDHLAAEKPVVKSPLPDYAIHPLGTSKLSTPLAGVVGTILCFIIPFSLHLLRKK